MADLHRAHWGRLVGGAAMVLAGAFTLPHLVRAPDLQENRTLAQAPGLPSGLGGLTAYRKAMDAYVADQFPPRAQLISGLNAVRAYFGVSGSSRVVVGRDGWLFSDNGSHLGSVRGDPPLSADETRAWLGGLAGRTQALRAQRRAYVVLITPVKETVYPDKAPDWFTLDPNRAAVKLSDLAAASGAGEVVYPHGLIAQQARWGVHVYDRYDSHWTGLGAYRGYVAFMQALQRQRVGEAPRPLESFTELTDQPLAATPRDLGLMLGVASFGQLNFPQFSDPAAVGKLRIAYLEGSPDWRGLRVIDTGQVGKPVLLMTVDSFSNGLMPFLYGHFSRIITAHNDQGFWRPELIERFQPDIVATEVIESGASAIMEPSPAPSPQARERVVHAVARWRPKSADRRPPIYTGPRRLISGSEGSDSLAGSRRPDDIQGRRGDDTISGLGDDDILRGGRGRDSIDGGLGADWISGGRDDDVLRGGPGADAFDSFEGAGTDVVLDFDPGDGDRVEIAVGTAYTVRQAGPDVIIELKGARLVLRGVDLADLPPGWIRNS